MKRFCMLLSLVALTALLFVPPTAATAKRTGFKPKLAVTIVKTSQAQARASGKIRVRVKVRVSRKAPKKLRRTPRKVRLSLTGKTDWAASSTATHSLTVKVRPNRRKVVNLKLNEHGRLIVSDCGTPTVRLSATLKRPRQIRRASRSLASLGSLCDVPADVDLARGATCDFIAGPGNSCLAPFPNDFYTRPDSSSATGLRVDLDPEATPMASPSSEFPDGKHIEVGALNQSDGFSPGPLISLRIPGLDNQAAFTRSGIVPLGAMSRTYEPDQPVVLIDTATGQRQLIWAELDSNAATDSDRNLIIRPGKNLQNGHRYVVALRNLKDANGSPIPAPPGFRLYRDADRTGNPLIENRRAGFESVFETLSTAGIDRSSLYLAWDFTVASAENVTGRMLSIRNRAFAGLGDTNLTDGVIQGSAPNFQIDSVTDYGTNMSGEGEEDIRVIRGTVEVPCYLNQTECPSGATFNLDADQKPIRIEGNTMDARFVCNIPRSAVDYVDSGDLDNLPDTWVVAEKARPSLYGHGLFGSINEVTSRNIRQLGTENNVIVCGTDWVGMSTGDVFPTALNALQDLSKFPALPDRLQQGFLNFLFLGRLLVHPQGFAADPAFRFNGQPVLDTSDLFYYGNSQGGIAGGALTAVATDFTRSVLYVPGMNYSTLLTRSTDFHDYSAVLYPTYSNELERPSVFALMQMLWDRGEPNGYANHMTGNPLPGTPAHKVMIVMAYGDHQVANVATEVEARTIGAPIRTGAGGLSGGVVSADRHAAGLIEPFYGHEILGDLNGPAADGNAFFVWDIGPERIESGQLYGTEPAPLTNTSPVTSGSSDGLDDGYGIDPHDTVIRSSPLVRGQIADFLKTNGKVTDPCGSNPCWAAGWMGMP